MLTRERFTVVILTLASILGVNGTAHAATANLSATVTDANDQPFKDVLILFAMVDDPSRSFTLGQNEAGAYADSVEVPQGQSSWNITRVVATGYLPMRIGVTTRASGTVVQKIEDTELNPGIPIPEITLVGGGSTKIRLTLGERAVVMKRFAALREQAAAEEAESVAAADTTFNRALRAYNAGDVDGATALFDEAISEDPQNAELRVTYAKLLYQAKRFEEFEKTASGALQIEPGNGELRMMVYSSARERGDMKAALAALLAVKGAGLAGADLAQHLDYVARKLGQDADAIPAWSAILELDPTNADACVNLAFLHSAEGDSENADEYLARAVELVPQQAPAIYLDMASKLLAGETVPAARLERGVSLLRKALELAPSFAPAHRKLGLALWKQKDWAGTRQALEKYLELSPEAEDRDTIEDYLSRLPE